MWTQRLRAALIADAYRPYLPAGSRVLDVGCGNGVVSAEVARRLALDLTGTDVVDYRRERVRFVPMEEGRLPFGDRSFDAVLLNDVLHHLTDQARIMAEARRVGQTVLAFELAPGSAARSFDIAINRVHHGGMPVPGAYRSAGGWREFLAANGWPAIVTDLGRPRWWYPFRHILVVMPGK